MAFGRSVPETNETHGVLSRDKLREACDEFVTVCYSRLLEDEVLDSVTFRPVYGPQKTLPILAADASAGQERELSMGPGYPLGIGTSREHVVDDGPDMCSAPMQ